ncbi:hypothetical protein U1Q18_022692, partial [Sarracenia purpurea var. burkii]
FSKKNTASNMRKSREVQKLRQKLHSVKMERTMERKRETGERRGEEGGGSAIVTGADPVPTHHRHNRRQREKRSRPRQTRKQKPDRERDRGEGRRPAPPPASPGAADEGKEEGEKREDVTAGQKQKRNWEYRTVDREPLEAIFTPIRVNFFILLRQR